jgi:hypothetical protein
LEIKKMIQTLITNKTHTPTRVGWRTGCSTALQPGESQLVDGAPFEFRNAREEAALRQRVAAGHIEIAYVMGDDDVVVSLDVAGKKVAESKAKIAAKAAAKVTTAPPVAPAPAPPSVPENPNPNAGNESLLNAGSIEDSKPAAKHALPGTEDDAGLDGPKETVNLFTDLPPMTAEAQAHIVTEKLTREQLKGIEKVKGTGDKGALTLDDVKNFLNPPAEYEFGSDAAEKLAKEAKLTDAELASIKASGKKGLTKGDVQKFIDSKG